LPASQPCRPCPTSSAAAEGQRKARARDSAHLTAFTAEIGARNRPLALAKLDQRTREARLLRETVRDLTRHVGGHPSATQRALIERAAWLTLHVAQLDAKAAATGGMTDHAARQYLAWSNSLTRTLRELGLKGPAERAPTLAEVIATPAVPISPAQYTSTVPAKLTTVPETPLTPADRQVVDPL
jgi:hypothetical protein